MAKFLKSIFNPTEKRKTHYEGEGGDDKNDGTPPLDDRRKLSISRSGRMRQANKKRHSLSLELYGDDVQSDAKSKKGQCSVKNVVSAPADFIDRRISSETNNSLDFNSVKSLSNDEMDSPESKHRRMSAGPASPDEEIDSYFEVIDKS